MRIASTKKLSQRIISTGFAFVLALSTVSTSASLLFTKTADALPLGQTQLRLSSAAPSAINAGQTVSFSVKQVGGLGGDGWTDILTSFWNATIEATVAEGQLSTNCSTFTTNTAKVTITPFAKTVQGTFCYKGTKAGAQTIKLKSTIPQVGVTIVNTVDVPVTVNQVGVPTNLTPGNGTFTNDHGFAMGWDKVGNATKYEYQTSYTKSGSNLGPLVYEDNSSSSNYDLSGSKVVRGNSNTPDANYYWQVRAGDDYGNWSNWSAINLVTVDAAKPSKPVLALPSNGSFLDTNEFDFDWNDSSDASPLTYEFQSSQDPSRDGNSVLNGSNIWKSGVLPTSMIHSSGAPDGAWFYQVRALDAAGNYSDWSDIWAVVLDTVDPALAFTGTTPANGAYVRGIVPIQTIITDANPSAYNLRIEDGAPAPLSLGLDYIFATVSGATNSYSWNTQSGLKAVSDGSHKIVATTKDKADNKTTITRNVIVDNTKPTVSIVAPALATYNPTAIQINAVDNIALKTVTANIYDENNSVLKKSCSQAAVPALTTTYTLNCAISGLADGIYTIRYNANDQAGNVATTATRQFTIDTEGPEVTLSGFDTEGNVITPIITATDANEPLTYSWSGSNANATRSADDVLTPAFTVTADGTYSFDLDVTDAAGNVTTKTFTFSYAAPIVPPAPFVQPASFVAGAQTAGPTNGFANVALNDSDGAVTNESQVLGATAQDDEDKEVLAATTTSEIKDGAKVLGLDWYWWLPILAAGAGAAWWLIAFWRRRGEEA